MPKSPDRQARLAKALRENLKRRKAKGRDDGLRSPDDGEPSPCPQTEGHAERESGRNPAEKAR